MNFKFVLVLNNLKLRNYNKYILLDFSPIQSMSMKFLAEKLAILSISRQNNPCEYS